MPTLNYTPSDGDSTTQQIEPVNFPPTVNWVHTSDEVTGIVSMNLSTFKQSKALVWDNIITPLRNEFTANSWFADAVKLTAGTSRLSIVGSGNDGVEAEILHGDGSEIASEWSFVDTDTDQAPDIGTTVITRDYDSVEDVELNQIATLVQSAAIESLTFSTQQQFSSSWTFTFDRFDTVFDYLYPLATVSASASGLDITAEWTYDTGQADEILPTFVEVQFKKDSEGPGLWATATGSPVAYNGTSLTFTVVDETTYNVRVRPINGNMFQDWQETNVVVDGGSTVKQSVGWRPDWPLSLNTNTWR